MFIVFKYNINPFQHVPIKIQTMNSLWHGNVEKISMSEGQCPSRHAAMQFRMDVVTVTRTADQSCFGIQRPDRTAEDSSGGPVGLPISPLRSETQ